MRFYKLGATMNNEKCLMSMKTDFQFLNVSETLCPVTGQNYYKCISK